MRKHDRSSHPRHNDSKEVVAQTRNPRARIRPIQGGIQIAGPRNNGTLGLILLSGDYGPGFITAGHALGGSASPVGQPDDRVENEVGTVVVNGYPHNKEDIAFVRVQTGVENDPLGVFGTLTDFGVNALGSWPKKGDVVRMQGAASGESNGQVEIANANIKVGGTELFGVSLADYKHQPGDSGAPVLLLHGESVVLMGIHGGSVTSEGRTLAYFTPLATVVKLTGSLIGWIEKGGTEYEDGQCPAIAINDSAFAVELHCGTGANADKLYSCGGALVPGGIEWDQAIAYDRGRNPAVAMNARGVVVEIHQGTGTDGDLYYRVGELVMDGVSWAGAAAVRFEAGQHPSIVIDNDDNIIEVHNGTGAQSNSLYYRTGKLRGATIEWDGMAATRLGAGHRPRVAMNQGGTLVMVFSEENGGEQLYYRVGAYADRRVTWRSPIPYDRGLTPSVAIDDDGGLMVVHTDNATPAKHSFFRLGTIADGMLTWGAAGALRYDTGQNPAIALDNQGNILEVHGGNYEPTKLFFRVASVTFNPPSPDASGESGDPGPIA